MEIMTVEQTKFYDDSYVFDQKQGFDIAVAFTDADNEREETLDPSIGTLVFEIENWTTLSDGRFKDNLTIIES